jgi:hypothetical protein
MWRALVGSGRLGSGCLVLRASTRENLVGKKWGYDSTSMHCSILGQNFSIFKKLEKFIQHSILGQIFPFLLEKNGKIRRVI